MNISLKEVNSNNDIKIFGEYKVELIKFHQEYAEKLGLFDKVVDNYNFNDAIRHIKQKGFKIFTCLSSQLIHKHAKSTGGIYSSFVIYYMTRNQILFNRKYLNSIQYYLFILKTISRNLLKIIFYSFKNLKSSKSIFTGTIDGILNKKGKKES